MFEKPERLKRYHVVTRGGVEYYLRRVQHAARQYMVPIPREHLQKLGLYQGRVIQMWVENGELRIKPLQDDVVEAVRESLCATTSSTSS